MKLYFLLEDQKSFMKVLPSWLEKCLPGYKRVYSVEALYDGSYIIESGYGYPNIKNVLIDKLIMFSKGKIQPDCIVVFYDVDDWTENKISGIRSMFDNIFISSGLDIDYQLLPIRRCFETWLLGNRDVFPKIADEQFRKYAEFYDVCQNDPEMMMCPAEYEDKVAMYHYSYPQCMLKLSTGRKYTKGHPGIAADISYLDSLLQRMKDTNDMDSFRRFIVFLQGTSSTNR
ncbi:MAG: hypothetical protein IKH16_03815 [Selenomonadaceae bacterium]|nr:hypothetical protein [Selenomonadaceae bacterium]